MQSMTPTEREAYFRFVKAVADGSEPDPRDAATVDAIGIDWEDMAAGPQDV
jgi:hypothetical protein